MTTGGVLLVPLPAGIGVESDPSRPEAGRLVADTVDDLHRLRLEIDLALGSADGATGESEIARRLAAGRRRPSPWELGEGPCVVPGCTTPGAHVHRPGDLTRGSTLPDPGVSGETAASTADWPARTWVAWLRTAGVSQPEALRHIRRVAADRGHPLPTSLELARSSPEIRQDLIDLVEDRLTTEAAAREPFA